MESLASYLLHIKSRNSKMTQISWTKDFHRCWRLEGAASSVKRRRYSFWSIPRIYPESLYPGLRRKQGKQDEISQGLFDFLCAKPTCGFKKIDPAPPIFLSHRRSTLHHVAHRNAFPNVHQTTFLHQLATPRHRLRAPGSNCDGPGRLGIDV